MTIRYRFCPRKMALRRHVLENWLSGIDKLRKVNVSVTESIGDCWKERHSITVTRKKAILLIFKLLKIVLCSSCDGVPYKIQKEKWSGLQFTRTDYLSLVLTLLRLRWTICTFIFLSEVRHNAHFISNWEHKLLSLPSLNRQLVSPIHGVGLEKGEGVGTANLNGHLCSLHLPPWPTKWSRTLPLPVSRGATVAKYIYNVCSVDFQMESSVCLRSCIVR